MSAPVHLKLCVRAHPDCEVTVIQRREHTEIWRWSAADEGYELVTTWPGEYGWRPAALALAAEPSLTLATNPEDIRVSGIDGFPAEVIALACADAASKTKARELAEGVDHDEHSTISG